MVRFSQKLALLALLCGVLCVYAHSDTLEEIRRKAEDASDAQQSATEKLAHKLDEAKETIRELSTKAEEALKHGVSEAAKTASDFASGTRRSAEDAAHHASHAAQVRCRHSVCPCSWCF